MTGPAKSRRPASLATLAIGGALLAAVVAVGWWQFGQPPPAGMSATHPVVVTRGRAVYEEKCAACHGRNLEGQPTWPSRLPNGRMTAPPHDASGHTWHHPAQVLFDIVRDGMRSVAPAGYESDMLAYRGVLTDADIWAVLAYIRSRWPEDIQRKHEQFEAAHRRK